MKGIFINYRREDSIGYAGRIYDRISTHFGRERVFMDIDTISPGDDFRETIEQTCDSSAVVLALIAKSWTTLTDKSGRRRLDNPNDFVRLELERALATGIRVIPVLLDDAEMPDPDRLPDDLKNLAYRHAIQISSVRFHHDVDRLIEIVDKVLARISTEEQRELQKTAAEEERQAEEAERERQRHYDEVANLAEAERPGQSGPTAANHLVHNAADGGATVVLPDTQTGADLEARAPTVAEEEQRLSGDLRENARLEMPTPPGAAPQDAGGPRKFLFPVLIFVAATSALIFVAVYAYVHTGRVNSSEHSNKTVAVGDANQPSATPAPAPGPVHKVKNSKEIIRGSEGGNQQSPAKEGTWERAGVGDYPSADWSNSTGSRPDPAKCTSAHAGQTAVCWDGTSYRNGFERTNEAWCTYKTVAPESIRLEPEPARGSRMSAGHSRRRPETTVGRNCPWTPRLRGCRSP